MGATQLLRTPLIPRPGAGTNSAPGLRRVRPVAGAGFNGCWLGRLFGAQRVRGVRFRLSAAEGGVRISIMPTCRVMCEMWLRIGGAYLNVLFPLVHHAGPLRIRSALNGVIGRRGSVTI